MTKPLRLSDLIVLMLDMTLPGHEIRFWRDAQGDAWVSITYPDGRTQIAKRTSKPLEGAACDAQRPSTIN